MGVLLVALVLPVGPSGCGGGDEGAASSQCTNGSGGGQCVLSVTLSGGKAYDYVVDQSSLPVLAGGLRVNALVQTGRAEVRVSWQDTAGQEVAAVVKPGSAQSLQGVVAVGDAGGRQRFVIHFRPSGSASTKVDVTITYG
jgi:hypothetical protein